LNCPAELPVKPIKSPINELLNNGCLTNQARPVINTLVKLTLIVAFQAIFLKSDRAGNLGPREQVSEGRFI
jgi:hypothetical protein